MSQNGHGLTFAMLFLEFSDVGFCAVTFSHKQTHGFGKRPLQMGIADFTAAIAIQFASFDQGRKVFAFSNWPDILGYCGDVLFPLIALNQIVQLGDSGLLFESGYTSKQKFQAIVDKLNHLFAEYPKLESGITCKLASDSIVSLYEN